MSETEAERLPVVIGLPGHSKHQYNRCLLMARKRQDHAGSTSLASCDVSDACDLLGIAAVRTGALRPLWPECPPTGGPLTTVRLDTGAADTPLPQLLDVLAAAAGRVILVDLGGRLDVQCWGTALASAARHFGVLGALVNGAARDVDGLRELGFATYARGVYPAAMRGRLGLAAVDEPVELEGSIVEAGSFAVADASGAVFLPAGSADAVLALAADLRAKEESRLRAIRSGADPRTVFGPADAPTEP
jgi:4-hydroxy-4-methyl-2-oxoglutarate aldolase